jgi:hypothetical protein
VELGQWLQIHYEYSWMIGPFMRVHRDEYPKMAAAARDYLAIPASEVSVEINLTLEEIYWGSGDFR